MASIGTVVSDKKGPYFSLVMLDDPRYDDEFYFYHWHFDNDKTPYNKSGWKEAFDVVCKEFNLNVVAVSNVGPVVDGPWEGWKCIGNSLYVGNNAEEYTELPYGEKADTIVYQTIVLKERPARGTAWSKYWRDKNKM